MAPEASLIRVEIAWAAPGQQLLRELRVPEGSTAFDVLWRSGVVQELGLDAAALSLGIFGKPITNPRRQLLLEGERLEIYRPLIADPKEARRKRASRAKTRKTA